MARNCYATTKSDNPTNVNRLTFTGLTSVTRLLAPNQLLFITVAVHSVVILMQIEKFLFQYIQLLPSDVLSCTACFLWSCGSLSYITFFNRSERQTRFMSTAISVLERQRAVKRYSPGSDNTFFECINEKYACLASNEDDFCSTSTFAEQLQQSRLSRRFHVNVHIVETNITALQMLHLSLNCDHTNSSKTQTIPGSACLLHTSI